MCVKLLLIRGDQADEGLDGLLCLFSFGPDENLLSFLLAPRDFKFSGLLAFASRPPLVTVIREENCLAILTNCAAGRACKPSSDPTVASPDRERPLSHCLPIPVNESGKQLQPPPRPGRSWSTKTLFGPARDTRLCQRLFVVNLRLLCTGNTEEGGSNFTPLFLLRSFCLYYRAGATGRACGPANHRPRAEPRSRARAARRRRRSSVVPWEHWSWPRSWERWPWPAGPRSWEPEQQP